MSSFPALRQRAALIARSVLRGVPDGVLARLLPGNLGWDPQDVDVAEDGSAARVRLLVAPANSAGQGLRWARAAREHLEDVSASNLMIETQNMRRLAFAADFSVPEGAYVFAHGWQRRQQRALLRDFTHLLLESGRYPYGSVPGHTPLQAAEGLVDRGLRVALIWHGSDIRLPSAHARWEKDSPFGEGGSHPHEATRLLESNAQARLQMILDSDLPVFVSTPGLLDVPRAVWVPVVIEPEVWRAEDPPLQRIRPVVAFAPSSSTLKGDASIDHDLLGLEAEGLIEYRRVEGVPSVQMPEIYRSADIVLDQFRLGDYGVAACEAMAAGRVVIGHVHDDVRRRVRELTGMDLPIVESRFGALAETIRHILDDRARFIDHAATGQVFARLIHDGRRSAQALSDFLAASPAGPQHTQETIS